MSFHFSCYLLVVLLLHTPFTRLPLINLLPSLFHPTPFPVLLPSPIPARCYFSEFDILSIFFTIDCKKIDNISDSLPPFPSCFPSPLTSPSSPPLPFPSPSFSFHFQFILFLSRLVLYQIHCQMSSFPLFPFPSTFHIRLFLLMFFPSLGLGA